MVAALSKAVFTSLAGVPVLKRLASRYGMSPGGLARRFVAGETLADAIEVARTLEARGDFVTLDRLGEHERSTESADEATRACVAVMAEVARAGIGRNLSVKLTQLGLDVDRATSLDNLRRVLEGAAQHEFFVRVDMESSRYTDATLEIVETVWGIGYRQVGVVLQAALHRTEQDLKQVNALGMSVRLVKGAYREPRDIAFQHHQDVDAAFVRLMQVLLREGTTPAIATHDPHLIAATREFAARERIGQDRFEFQMLYGVRQDLQAALRQAGYRFRVYVPFGHDWFPYVMRRLAERPENIAFVLRAIRDRHKM
jgi:proline dehydrogenase